MIYENQNIFIKYILKYKKIEPRKLVLAGDFFHSKACKMST
jgi:hypothetical protein